MGLHLRKIILWFMLISNLSASGADQNKSTKAKDHSDTKLCEESWLFENRDYVKRLVSMLDAGETIVLAVIGDEFSCQYTLISDPTERAEFLKRIENLIIEDYTKSIVQNTYFVNHPKFAVVDRKAVTRILDELKFQQTGFVTKEMRDQLGNLLGVTHLLMVSLCRATESNKPQGYSYTDSVDIKLIELKLGKILTMETGYCHYFGGQGTKWTKRVIYSQDRSDFKFKETQ